MKQIFKLALLLFAFPIFSTVVAQEKMNLHHIGEFSHEGEYVKDYFVIKEGDIFHLFYNVGVASPTQNWQEPNNEKEFGHATSKDLKIWKYHPYIFFKLWVLFNK